MCGFVGYAFEGNPPGGLLERMNATIRHRGPDGEGFFREGGIGLGHRRLAVIDVEGGRQPLYNEDESVVVVYNGEIYNFQELRGRLEDRGHRFATNTDTEVLVHLYEEEGESFLPRLNGIFAFALYDRKRRLLMLARDPVGVKPLYYGIVDGGVLFGSELKALAACERFSRKIDPEALSAYLTLEYVPNPMSLYRDARKLLPGHALILEGLRERVFRYWDWPPIEPFAGDYDSAQEALRDAVRTSVREQMISDVPLGVFLSGGVDSSVVADSAVAAGGDVQTYSIGFEEPSFDESGFARRTAEHLETVHGDRLFSERELLEGLPGILASMDEPLADPSLLPSALLSAFARESITVALGGDGGDELFAGYPTYWVHRLHP